MADIEKRVLVTYNQLAERMARGGMGRKTAEEILANQVLIADIGRMVAGELKSLKADGVGDPIGELMRHGLARHSSRPEVGPQTAHALAAVLTDFHTLIWGFKMATGRLEADRDAELDFTSPYYNGEVRDPENLTAFEARNKLNTAGKWSTFAKDRLKEYGLLT